MSDTEPKGQKFSLCGKYAKVVEWHSDDVLSSILICPHCGRHVTGNDIRVGFGGKTCCEDCIEELNKLVIRLKKEDPENWFNRKELEPYGV